MVERVCCCRTFVEQAAHSCTFSFFLFFSYSSTAAEDDDAEWGWDDEPSPPKRNTHRSVEMVGSRSLNHRRSKSPTHFGSGSSSGGGSSYGSSPTPVARGGLSVKRSGGLKNPLHANKLQQQQQQRPAAAAPPPPPPAVVKKQAVQPDDFFEDFGFGASASKPKFVPANKKAAAAKTTPTLGATRLAVEDDSGNGDDNWGDDDLDDLLDD